MHFAFGYDNISMQSKKQTQRRLTKTKKEFLNRVLHEGVVDTRKYRYIVIESGADIVVKRLPIEDLNTTEAIDGWETVCKIEK